MKCNRGFGRLATGLLLIPVVVLFASSVWAQTKFKILDRFTGGADGGSPSADLIFDQAGNLYGTTQGGGDLPTCGCGTVFKLTPDAGGRWTESVLYSFVYSFGGGKVPVAGLVFDSAGNLYGTTITGGPNGYGTVFRLTPNSDGSWTESLLYQFTGNRDGGTPQSRLIVDQQGNLYGTARQGGGYARPSGVVFKLTPAQDGTWKESVLYDFCSLAKCADGASPVGGLIFDQAGNLYGTATHGGTRQHGVVFRLTPNLDGSWTESVLNDFPGIQYGRYPSGDLTFDAAGSLYGTTSSGGNFSQCSGFGCGAIFQLTPKNNGSWKAKVLHNFTGGKDGGEPIAGVIFDQAGNLYGTNIRGGILSDCEGRGCGVAFKLAPSADGRWKESALHRFTDTNGGSPYAGLVLDVLGNLYGTNYGDGVTTFGSVFEITP